MIKVIKPGLETSLQDYPGRVGYRNQGFPISGPFDSWSFRLANLLVGNEVGAAAFEAQFIGPELEFQENVVFAITGGNMQPKLCGVAISLNESIQAKKGDVLSMSFSLQGARTYIAFAGGVKSTPWLGSQSTFHKAGIGGIDGRALKAGDTITLNNSTTAIVGQRVKDEFLPTFSKNKIWEIEVVAGPNDDWIDEEGHKRFLNEPWKLDAKSDRTGFRLNGPDWTFTKKALNKTADHGSDPANIIDHGYPVGGINLAGQTPIILVSDGPSMGGFICPYTVPTCAFYKLAQSKSGEIYNFKLITVEKSQEMAREISKKCSIDAIELIKV